MGRFTGTTRFGLGIIAAVVCLRILTYLFLKYLFGRIFATFWFSPLWLLSLLLPSIIRLVSIIHLLLRRHRRRTTK